MHRIAAVTILCVFASCGSSEDQPSAAPTQPAAETSADSQPSGQDVPTSAATPSDSESIAGKWMMIFRSGAEAPASFEHVGDSRYRLITRGNFAGEYERTGDFLKIVVPNNKRMTPLVFRIDKPGSMVVVEAPAVGVFGSDYTGVRLERGSLAQIKE